MSLPCTHSVHQSFLLSPDLSPHLSNEGAREMCHLLSKVSQVGRTIWFRVQSAGRPHGPNYMPRDHIKKASVLVCTCNPIIPTLRWETEAKNPLGSVRQAYTVWHQKPRELGLSKRKERTDSGAPSPSSNSHAYTVTHPRSKPHQLSRAGS